MKTPPHFSTNHIILKLNNIYLIDYNIRKEFSLSFPYETNCIDYELRSEELFPLE